MRFKALLIVLFCQFSVFSILAQTEADSTKDRSGTFLELPVISFSPETSLRLGAISVYFFTVGGERENTHLSTLKLPLTYTLNNQFKARFSYQVFLDQNRHLFSGHAEWLRFPLFFYGIGPEARDEDEEIYTTRTIGIEFNYLARLDRDYFLGMRFIRNDSKTVETEEEGLLTKPDLVPGAEGGVNAGIGVIGRIDKRDNVFNSGTGPFFELAFSSYNSLLGSDFDFEKLRLDFRHYLPVMNDRHVFAFNIIGEHNWGHPSFESMALLGGDEVMRGHYIGRFRDKVMLVTQAEYRLPLFREKWFDERKKMPFWERWGLAVFGGIGNVAPELKDLSTDELKGSFGLGLRYLAKPEERVNIRIDFGFGTQAPGFYLNIREAF